MTKGELTFKYGTMGSGKSLLLLATAHNFQLRSIPFLILKSTIDTRDGQNTIHSRALLNGRECVSITPEHNIYNLITDYISLGYDRIKWILVDEAQFLTENQV